MRNPTALTDVQISGDIDSSEAIAMGVDVEGMSILLSLLSNLYSDTALAVVREYACNARDAHVDAGQERPVEVSLPNSFEPQLLIKDYGTGLTKDEILRIYAQYGASTKRESDEMIGAFGVGSKSAFSMGTMFTVTGVKAGAKTIALFSLTEGGIPTVQFLYDGPTDEPNGVTVEIGVHDINAVHQAAEKLFQCWPKGSVLVDGKEPYSIFEQAHLLADVKLDGLPDGHVFIDNNHTPTYGESRFKLIMGGVPYSIPDSVWSHQAMSAKAREIATSLTPLPKRYLLDVAIGSVEITPSREELRDTLKTVRTIDAMIQALERGLQKWIMVQVDAAPDIWSAGEDWANLAKQVFGDARKDPVGITWKGKSLGGRYVLLPYPAFKQDWQWSGGRDRVMRTVHNVNWSTSIGSFDPKGTLFVLGVPDGKDHIVRRYTKSYFLSKDYTFIEVVASPRRVERLGWFTYGRGTNGRVQTMLYDDFVKKGKELLKARQKAEGYVAKDSTKYTSMIDGDAYWTPRTATEIAAMGDKPVFYSQANFVVDRSNPVHKKLLKDGSVLVRLSGQMSPEVLKRKLPRAKQVEDSVHKLAQEMVANMPATDRSALQRFQKVNNTNLGAVRFVRENRTSIKSKKVLAALDQYEADYKIVTADSDTFEFWKRVYKVAGLAFPYAAKDLKDFFTLNVPLLAVTQNAAYYGEQMLGAAKFREALIEYINLVAT